MSVRKRKNALENDRGQRVADDRPSIETVARPKSARIAFLVRLDLEPVGDDDHTRGGDAVGLELRDLAPGNRHARARAPDHAPADRAVEPALQVEGAPVFDEGARRADHVRPAQAPGDSVRQRVERAPVPHKVHDVGALHRFTHRA